jgi:formylglycine-generating enzyme required for sulfatase activity
MKKFLQLTIAILFLTPIQADAARFTYDANTVSDIVTGLMWQREDDNVTRNWRDSLAYCENLGLGGYTDWRLPNIKELRSIVDNTTFAPAIAESVFLNSKSADYWSSTTSVEYPDDAWGVYFYGGSVEEFWKDGNIYTRCVR